MDVFQGAYRNRTEGMLDCRYFAAVYLVLRPTPWKWSCLGEYKRRIKSTKEIQVPYSKQRDQRLPQWRWLHVGGGYHTELRGWG